MPYDINIPGWMTLNDLTVLEELARQVPENGKIVEIGSLYGRSSACLAMSALPTVVVYCIDIFRDDDSKNVHDFPEEVYKKHGYPDPNVYMNSYKDFSRNIMLKFKNVQMIRARSPYFNGIEVPNDVDMIFIDSEHKNPNDWDNLSYWLPRLKSGGILCGHDYGGHAPDVVLNVKRLSSMFGIEHVLTSNSSMWYMKFPNRIHKVE